MSRIIFKIHPTQLTYHEVGMQINYRVDNDDMFSQLGNKTLLGFHFYAGGYTLYLEYSNGNPLAIPGKPGDGAEVQILALTNEPDDQS